MAVRVFGQPVFLAKKLAFDWVGPIISVRGIVTRKIAVRVD
ncbi:MAG: hypothetical protein WBS20_14765 [Lysobacterales bacterium]